MKVAHPTATGVAVEGDYKVFSIYLTSGSDAASVTVVNSADGEGTPDKIGKISVDAANKTAQLVFPGGVNATKGIYISALSGTSPTVGIQYDG